MNGLPDEKRRAFLEPPGVGLALTAAAVVAEDLCAGLASTTRARAAGLASGYRAS